MSKIIFGYEKDFVLAELSEGLAATQAEKLRTLTENIEASTIEVFQEKAEIIKESFFKQPEKQVVVKEETIKPKHDNAMSAYIGHAIAYNKNK